MKYIWYKNNRVCVKSWDVERVEVFGITQEYFDDYIAIHKHYDRCLMLHGADITSLGELESVDGHLDLSDSLITTLGNLERVSEFLFAENTQLTSLGNLNYVHGSIYCNEGSDTHKLLMDSKFKDQVVT